MKPKHTPIIMKPAKSHITTKSYDRPDHTNKDDDADKTGADNDNDHTQNKKAKQSRSSSKDQREINLDSIENGNSTNQTITPH